MTITLGKPVAIVLQRFNYSDFEISN